ncbi:hypothetical protein R1flu_014802, partial [Riccia fluitans]
EVSLRRKEICSLRRNETRSRRFFVLATGSFLKKDEHIHDKSRNPKSTKKRASVTVTHEKFLIVFCDALAEYQYVGSNQRSELMLACRVREKRTSVTVLLCGTSRCGKLTLSSLLASRLGIIIVVSTDSVHHMMRSFVNEKENHCWIQQQTQLR